MTASSIFVPFGLAQSNGTGTLAHWNWLLRAAGGSVHLVHAIPGFGRPGRAVVAAADGVLSDTAMRPTTAIADAARIRRRWLPFAMPLAITPPSAEDQLTITAQLTPNKQESLDTPAPFQAARFLLRQSRSCRGQTPGR
jgi:hypothetical protein